MPRAGYRVIEVIVADGLADLVANACWGLPGVWARDRSWRSPDVAPQVEDVLFGDVPLEVEILAVGGQVFRGAWDDLAGEWSLPHGEGRLAREVVAGWRPVAGYTKEVFP